jgi:hypothetical protein
MPKGTAPNNVRNAIKPRPEVVLLAVTGISPAILTWAGVRSLGGVWRPLDDGSFVLVVSRSFANAQQRTMFASITRASRAAPLLIAEPQQNHHRAML